MPYRDFDTGFWSDPFVQKLPVEGKLLFAYLWTNRHCNQAGLYQITPSTIAFETKLAEADIPQLIQELAPKVTWYPEEDFVWVKNFLRRQAKSSKFVVAAIKSLNSCSVPDDLRAEFDLYNQRLLSGVAPSQHISLTKRECVLIRDNFRCQYCGKEIDEAADYEMDHIIPVIRGGKDNYLNLVASCRSCNQKKFDKTPAEAGVKQPKPSTFHGAQGTYILRNNHSVRKKWLKVFPERVAVVDLILGNIEPTLPGENNIDSRYTSAAAAGADADSEKRDGVVKGKGEKTTTGESIPPSESEIEESLSEGDREVISVWFSVKGFRMSLSDASELVARLRTEFPDVDILTESKVWAARKLSEPLKLESRPSAQIWNWMRKAREFAQERRKGEQQRKGVRAKPEQARRRPITYIRGSEPAGPEDTQDMP